MLNAPLSLNETTDDSLIPPNPRGHQGSNKVKAVNSYIMGVNNLQHHYISITDAVYFPQYMEYYL